MARLRAAGGLLVLTVTAAACGSSPTADKWSDPSKIDFYSGLHVNLSRMTRTAAGTFYWDSIRGTGTVPAHEGDKVSVRYILWLPDGTQVESSWTTAQEVTLNTDNLIAGWVHGLPGAVAGTTRQLVIPPEEGYGSLGSASGKVPANATLVFLVAVDRVTPASTSVVPLAGAPGGLGRRVVAAAAR